MVRACGGVMLLVGVALLWLAHGMSGMRLEVSRQAVFVSRGFLPPIRVEVAEITRLRPHAAQRYSGVLAKRGRRTVFTATSAMTGYGQLLDYLTAEGPDLFVSGGFR
jgi:hypothetical protein